MPITLNGTTGVVTPGATVGSLNGILKATSGVVSQAVAGTDYLTSASPAVAKAWVVFNGTFATSPFTIANGGIRSAFNVSSITDLGVANYRVNFDSGTMQDDNYVITGTVWDVFPPTTGADNYASGYIYLGSNAITNVTTSSFEFFCIGFAGGSGYDSPKITIACFN